MLLNESGLDHMGRIEWLNGRRTPRGAADRSLGWHPQREFGPGGGRIASLASAQVAEVPAL